MLESGYILKPMTTQQPNTFEPATLRYIEEKAKGTSDDNDTKYLNLYSSPTVC